MKNVLLLSLLLVAGTTCAFSDVVYISPSPVDVAPGQTFSVDVNIDNIPDLYDYQFSVSFNPAVLAADSITEGSLFASTNDTFFIPGTIDNTAGTITLTADTLIGNVPGISGPGAIAVINFTALSNGTSSIDFSPLSDFIFQDSLGNLLPVTPISATVDIGPFPSVPEPASFYLLATALGLIILGVWRRRPCRYRNCLPRHFA